MRRSRSRLVLAAVALFALTVVLILWLRPSAEPEPRFAKRPRTTVHWPVPVSANMPSDDEESEEPAPEAEEEEEEERIAGKVDRRDLFERVELDKKEACPGEDVRATMTQKPDVRSPVQFNVPGRSNGNPAIISFDEPGVQTVNVVANDGVGGLDYRSVELTVLDPDSPDCRAKPVVVVSAIVAGSEDDAAVVRVTAVRNLGPSLRYTFDFGDGTVERSTRQQTTHGYQLREQSAPTSTFVVKVTVEDERGRAAVGRASVSLRNTHWLSSVVGSPMIPVTLDRFPTRVGATFQTNISFRNIEAVPIKLEKVTLTMDTCTDREPTVKQYPAGQLLNGLVRLDANGKHDTSLSLPESDVAGACRVLALVEGDTVPPRVGKPIGPGMARTFDTTRAQFAVEVAPPPKDAMPAAAAVEIQSSAMIADLEKAHALLGPDRPISPEDLRRLKAEGRLD